MPSRGWNIAAWVASALLFVLYTVVASPPKLMSSAQAAEGFIKYGYTDGFRLFIGTCEFLGGIALLIPRLAFWSASGLIIIMIGAVYTHLSHGEVVQSSGAWSALALLALVAHVRRKQALFLS
jgi:putative oxidoreductase